MLVTNLKIETYVNTRTLLKHWLSNA